MKYYNINEEIANNIKIGLTTFDFTKERLFLYTICNLLAVKLIKENVDLDKVREIGLLLGYDLKEITILKSSAESIAEILILLYEANKNYISGFSVCDLVKSKNPFGITDVIPYDIIKELPKYELEINELAQLFRFALRG